MSSMRRSWTAHRSRRVPSARFGAYAIPCAPRAPCSIAAAPCCWREPPRTISPQARDLPWSSPRYFTTQRRVDALGSSRQRAASGTAGQASEAEKHGTVGAVARDIHGHLAAATSTGGFNNKPAGRVGDSPIIGAGTYAKDGVCAVSCTGLGEIFIRRVAAYDLAARITYGGQGLVEAANTLVFDTLASYGIGAGLVALGATGNPVTPFNTLGMYRGWISTDGELTVATHRDLYPMGPA